MKKLTRHLLSMTAAMAIGSSAVLSCGLPSALAAEAQEAEEAGKLVPVIIRLSGEAVLAGEGAAQLGTDYLDTPEATAKAEALRQTSSEAEAAIRSLYPELEVGYRFDLLMNGFSCELPKGLLDEARACPWVEDIEEIETVNIQRPDLYTAPELGEVSYFRETTGYFGEGEVIAVLDGEFDIDHDMFAPIDDKNNKLTKEDIIAAAGNLNVQVDPEQAYISSKLPYVIDYADDTPYESSDPKEFHGTHVSGIAAGNKISDADGNELSGIARDAQIIMMRVFGDVLVDEVQGTYQNAVKYDAALAALEDAATLRADVINMSFGSPEPDLDSISYKDTLKSLNNAGITIVAAAGNSSNNRIIEGTYLDMDAAVPDTQTVSEPSSFKEVLSVASANNSMRRDPCFKIEGLDDEIPFSVADDRILSEILDDGVYEYVYCGLGTPGDFEGKDLTGKIALVDRGGFTFSEKAYNAEQAGAVAMIVCDNIDEQSLIGMALDGVTLPSVFISLNNGIKMKEAESGKIRLDSTITVITPLDGGISGFSSFGPAEDLTLKPDIAGIGGSVTSAAKNNSLMQIEGTSMSSPYVAGCAAILDQYLRKNGMVLSGSAKTAFIKNLLMNSAVLFQNGDTYESPRRQGAGLVNLKNVLNDRVILTGEGGLAKVELKDKLTDKISFNVDIRNFSDQDVEFKEARLVLTAEDGAMIENDESGQISIIGSSNIGVTADLSSLLSTAAGETRTVTVSAQLSEADLAARSTSFPNGFFVEGYIILSGAENCCDVSIPVMGFCGDWTQAPIFHSGTKYLAPYQLFTTAGNGSFDASYSFAGVAEATARLIERLPEEDAEYVLANPFSIADYYDDEYFGDLMNCYSESTYLSPDGDGLSDRFGIVFSLLRSAHISGLRIYDSENNLVSESDAANVPAQKVVYSMSEEDLRSLPDGEYRGSFEGYIYYEGAENNPQAYDFPIVVDKKAPSLEVKPKEENGRKLIEITSADENLDGIFITGRGDGGIAGEYTADGAPLAELAGVNNALASLFVICADPNATARSESLLLNVITDFADEYEKNIYNSYDFSDVLPAYRYQDEDGSVSVTYDVTDLEDYMVTAVDKAFNTAEIMSDDRNAAHLRQGLWWAKNGGDADVYYNFWDSNEGNIRYQNGAPEKEFKFEQNGDTVAMKLKTGSSEETRTGKITFTDKSNAVITWDDGVTENLFYANPDGFANFDFSTTKQIGEIVADYHNNNSDSKAESAEVTYDEEGMGTVRLFDKSGSLIAEYTGYDRFENTAVDPSGKTVKFEYIRRGVYRVFQDPALSDKHYYVLFTEDNRAVVCSAEDGLLWDYTVDYNGNVLTGNKGMDSEVSVNVSHFSVSDHTVTFENGDEYYICYDPNFTAEDYKVFTVSQLEEMAADYCERLTGERPGLGSASFVDGGSYFMYFLDGETFTIDPLGADGFDIDKQVVDLKALPEIKDLFTPGLWSCMTEDSLKYYSSDGNGNITVIDPEDGSEETMKYNWIGTKAVELTSGGKTERVVASAVSDTDIFLVRDDNSVETLKYSGEGTIDSIVFYSDRELAEMAAADRSEKTGKDAKVSKTASDESGTVVITFDDGSEYMINRFSGIGTDEEGNEVDLPQTGNNDISTAAAAAGAGMLIMLGAAVMYVSVAFRRKEEC